MRRPTHLFCALSTLLLLMSSLHRHCATQTTEAPCSRMVPEVHTAKRINRTSDESDRHTDVAELVEPVKSESDSNGALIVDASPASVSPTTSDDDDKSPASRPFCSPMRKTFIRMQSTRNDGAPAKLTLSMGEPLRDDEQKSRVVGFSLLACEEGKHVAQADRISQDGRTQKTKGWGLDLAHRSDANGQGGRRDADYVYPSLVDSDEDGNQRVKKGSDDETQGVATMLSGHRSADMSLIRVRTTNNRLVVDDASVPPASTSAQAYRQKLNRILENATVTNCAVDFVPPQFEKRRVLNVHKPCRGIVLDEAERKFVLESRDHFRNPIFVSGVDLMPVERDGVLYDEHCAGTVRCDAHVCAKCSVLQTLCRRLLARRDDPTRADLKLSSTRHGYLTPEGIKAQVTAVLRGRLAKTAKRTESLVAENRELKRAVAAKRPRLADTSATERYIQEMHKRVDDLQEVAKQVLEPQCLWGGCCTKLSSHFALSSHVRAHLDEVYRSIDFSVWQRRHKCEWLGCGKSFSKLCLLCKHVKRDHTKPKQQVKGLLDKMPSTLKNSSRSCHGYRYTQSEIRDLASCATTRSAVFRAQRQACGPSMGYRQLLAYREPFRFQAGFDVKTIQLMDKIFRARVRREYNENRPQFPPFMIRASRYLFLYLDGVNIRPEVRRYGSQLLGVSIEKPDGSRPPATDMLYFVIKSVFLPDFWMPIAYFPDSGFTAEWLRDTIHAILRELSRLGYWVTIQAVVQVVAIVKDGLRAHRTYEEMTREEMLERDPSRPFYPVCTPPSQQTCSRNVPLDNNTDDVVERELSRPISCTDVVQISDKPHASRNVRKHLKSADKFAGDDVHAASWKHVKAVYELDCKRARRTTRLNRRALNVKGKDKMCSDLLYRVVDKVTLNYILEKDTSGACSAFGASAMRGTHRYLTALADIANPGYEDEGPYYTSADRRLQRMEAGRAFFRSMQDESVARKLPASSRLTPETLAAIETCVSGEIAVLNNLLSPAFQSQFADDPEFVVGKSLKVNGKDLTQDVVEHMFGKFRMAACNGGNLTAYLLYLLSWMCPLKQAIRADMQLEPHYKVSRKSVVRRGDNPVKPVSVDYTALQLYTAHGEEAEADIKFASYLAWKFIHVQRAELENTAASRERLETFESFFALLGHNVQETKIRKGRPVTEVRLRCSRFPLIFLRYLDAKAPPLVSQPNLNLSGEDFLYSDAVACLLNDFLLKKMVRKAFSDCLDEEHAASDLAKYDDVFRLCFDSFIRSYMERSYDAWFAALLLPETLFEPRPVRRAAFNKNT